MVMAISSETVLGAAGVSGIVAGLGFVFAKRALEKVVDTAYKSFESILAKAEETHKKQLELAGNIDLDLREKRLVAYTEIWKQMRLLPKWPSAAEVRYEDLRELSRGFTKWYFDGGGMFMSSEARDAYGRLQDEIVDVLDTEKKESAPGSGIGGKYEAVREKCSQFRTAITNDLLSRRAAPLN
jgi:hypothetical protein